ncbi:MAG: glycosyltransferase family 2 protein [Acidobacteriota bacterium]|nr:glycosyltransferase family 2 protein [Acidobacteriota bacterium]
MPQLSVIIPAYNAAAFLPACLDSVLANSPGVELEVIVVDDGSSDATREVAARYGQRIRFFTLPHCGRPAEVRAFGIAQATAEVIAFLDADDEALPGRFARQLAILHSTGAGLVSCDARVVSPEGTVDSHLDRIGLRRLLQAAQRHGVIEDCFGLLIRTGGFINGGFMMVRREALARVGGFNPALRIGEDYELALRLSAAGKVAVDFEPGVLRREHGGNLSLDWQKRWPDTLRLYELLMTFPGVQARPELMRILRRRTAAVCRGLGSWMLRQGDVDAARRYWRQGSRLYRFSICTFFAMLGGLPGPFLLWLQGRR